jgi:pyruvate/2-oxoglutarate dehydrogenase complex dihydrolipoamide dehydrogenase (E3) component
LTKESYISIDENYQTNVENLFAIGDVTGMSKTYEEAKQHAIKAAELIINSFV